jgi:hypothetical protein
MAGGDGLTPRQRQIAEERDRLLRRQQCEAKGVHDWQLRMSVSEESAGITAYCDWCDERAPSEVTETLIAEKAAESREYLEPGQRLGSGYSRGQVDASGFYVNGVDTQPNGVSVNLQSGNSATFVAKFTEQ